MYQIDVKDEYKEVLESNNGIKVKQFVDSLPADQQTEILQLQQTQDLVELRFKTCTFRL